MDRPWVKGEDPMFRGVPSLAGAFKLILGLDGGAEPGLTVLIPVEAPFW